MNKTLIVCTDNSVDEQIFTIVKKNLQKQAGDTPIVCVSHTPVDLGKNIVIGPQKRCWLTLYKQLLIGLENSNTEYVGICEHDVLYHQEHLSWIPPRNDIFYYNENVWLMQWGGNHPELNGMFSRYWGERLALSQLICNRELYLNVIKKRVELIENDGDIVKGIDHVIEPGLSKTKGLKYWSKSGRPVYLKKFLDNIFELEKYETFNTEMSNVDIRHGSNFTGPKRGRKRTYKIPYWIDFDNIKRM